MKTILAALLASCSTLLAAPFIQNRYDTNTDAAAFAVVNNQISTGTAALANGVSGNGKNGTNVIYVDVTGSQANTGTYSSPFNLLSSAALIAPQFSKIVINPGTYFEATNLIWPTNNVIVIADGVNYTISNNNSGVSTDIRLSSSDIFQGGTWTHISTTPGNVNGIFGLAEGSGNDYFTNVVLRNLTISSDCGVFKYSATTTSNSDVTFYNCVFNGAYTATSSESVGSTLFASFYGCQAILTNSAFQLGNIRSAWKIRGNTAGYYYINNCRAIVSDLGITNFSSCFLTGHVPTGAGGNIVSNSININGLTIDMTSCTNPLSFNFNVHALTNAINANAVCNANGTRLTWSNYNAGMYPFQSNYYFNP